MLKRIKLLAVAAIAAVLVACGGGGGEGVPNFGGRYFESLTITSNTCGSIGTSFEAADTVVQNDRVININSDGLMLAGTVDSDNGGFTATGSGVFSGTPVQGTIKYRTVTAGSKYDVELSLIASGCTLTAKGTATLI